MPIPPHENLIVGACAIACVLLVATGLFAYQAPADPPPTPIVCSKEQKT